MPSLDLIQEFQRKNKVQISGESIKNSIERFLTQYTEQKLREEKIRAYVKKAYAQAAAEFERTKATDVHYHSENASTTTSLEFFEEYMNIISEIAKEASDGLVEGAKADEEKIKQTVTELQQSVKDNEVKVKTAYDNYYSREHNKGKDINQVQEYVKMNKELDLVRMNLKNAEVKLEELVAPVPLEDVNPYFGMTADEAKKLIETQVKSFNYMDERRKQIEEVGVRAPDYMSELENAFSNKDVTYNTANAEQKRGMQEVYATRKLMKEQDEQLKGKTSGFFGWFWRLWYRKEISAVTSYIKAADKALSDAGFAEADVQEADDTMTKNGYFYNEYKAIGVEKILEEKMPTNEIVNEPTDEQETELNDNLENAKEIEKTTASQEALGNEKSNLDKYFEFGFKPSYKDKEFNAQAKEFTEKIAKVVNQNKSILPKELVYVISANSKKFHDIKALSQIGKLNAHQGDLAVGKIEDDLATRVSRENYKPMTFEEFADMLEMKQRVKADTTEPNTNVEISKPVSENEVLNKDELAKQN